MKFGWRKMQGKAMPVWLVFLTGLLVGSFSSFLYYLSLHDVGEGAPDLVKKSIDTFSEFKGKLHRSHEPVVDSAEMNFDFYTLLPKLEMMVQKSPAPADPRRKNESDRTKQAVLAGDRFILQAGSFKNVKQAGKLKNRLGKLGIKTNIQKVTFKNRDIWYRVRVGPLHDHNSVVRIQNILKRNNINSFLMKLNS